MKRLLFGILLVFLFPTPSSAISPIVINEFYTPTSLDWVEIYNTSDIAIDVSSWYLKDSTSNIYTFPASSSVAPRSFLAVDVSNRLNKDGDTVILFDNSNQQVDTKEYASDPGDNITVGRYPDGDNWTLLQTLTKSSSNNSGNPVPTPTSTPAPTNTPTPTSSPTSTPVPTSGTTSTPKPASPTPTKKPTLTPKPTKSEEEVATDSNEIQLLGASTEEITIPTLTPLPTGKSKNRSSISPVPAIIIGLGLLMMAGGSAPLLFKYLKDRKIKSM